MVWQLACVLENILDSGVQLPRPSCPSTASYPRLFQVLSLSLLTGKPMSRKATESFARLLLTFAVDFGTSLLVLGNI